jgi:adenosylcobinamide kinase/adenosylcobinamide-phosphate guanylyltransferase
MGKKFVLITGGARSGKSVFAEETAKKMSKDRIYIATCIPFDSEMKERVKKHKNARGDSFVTVESPLDPLKIMKENDKKGRVFLIDCMTILVSNWLLKKTREDEIIKRTEELADFSVSCKASVVIVTNETGFGVVPPYRLGRIFRDLSGTANKILAGKAGQVYLTVSGIPVMIKGGEK